MINKGRGIPNLYNYSSWRPMAPFVRIFAELNRGDTCQGRLMWKYPLNVITLADFVLPDSTEIRRNIIRIVLQFCAIRVIYVLPKKKGGYILWRMKSDLHWNQSRDQNWHRRLETYLEQYRIMNGYQAAHMILQDTDWIKRVYCIPGGSRRNNERPDSAVTGRGFQDDAEVTEECQCNRISWQ